MLFNNMVVLSRAFWVPDGESRDRYPLDPILNEHRTVSAKQILNSRVQICCYI